MNSCYFQKVEEEIRQHWVHVKYADVEKSSEEPIVGTYASVLLLNDVLPYTANLRMVRLQRCAGVRHSVERYYGVWLFTVD